MRIPYGFIACGRNLMTVSQLEAAIVTFIFDQYLLGQSLGGIVKLLEENQIASPTGKSVWERATIDKLLPNGRYVPQVISFNKFSDVRFEKEERCNIDYYKIGTLRKKTRYSPKIILNHEQSLL